MLSSLHLSDETPAGNEEAFLYEKEEQFSGVLRAGRGEGEGDGGGVRKEGGGGGENGEWALIPLFKIADGIVGGETEDKFLDSLLGHEEGTDDDDGAEGWQSSGLKEGIINGRVADG